MAKRNTQLTPGELAQLRRIDTAARVLFDALEPVRLTKARKAALDALGEALFDPAGPLPGAVTRRNDPPVSGERVVASKPKRHRWERLTPWVAPPWVARCEDCGVVRYLSNRTTGRTTYYCIHEGCLYLAGFNAQACPAALQVEPALSSLYGYDSSHVAHLVVGTQGGVSFRCGAAGLAIMVYSLGLTGPLCPQCGSSESSR